MLSSVTEHHPLLARILGVSPVAAFPREPSGPGGSSSPVERPLNATSHLLPAHFPMCM